MSDRTSHVTDHDVPEQTSGPPTWPCMTCEPGRVPAGRYACRACEHKTRERLLALPRLSVTAGQAEQLMKSAGGDGGGGRPAPGSKPPLRLAAIDASTTIEALRGQRDSAPRKDGSFRRGWTGLHEWERIIREERCMAHVGSLPITAESQDFVRTVQLLVEHLEWACGQQWIDEFIHDVSSIHGIWRAAAKDIHVHRRLPCPAEVADGTNCGRMLDLDLADDDARVLCRSCHTEWSVDRLLLVAMTDPTPTFLDSDSIAGLLKISRSQVNRLAQRPTVRRHRGLIEVHDVHKEYLATARKKSKGKRSVAG